MNGGAEIGSDVFHCIQLGVEQALRPAVRLQKELALATAVKISEHPIANC
jgi:hypothetical protein